MSCRANAACPAAHRHLEEPREAQERAARQRARQERRRPAAAPRRRRRASRCASGPGPSWCRTRRAGARTPACSQAGLERAAPAPPGPRHEERPVVPPPTCARRRGRTIPSSASAMPTEPISRYFQVASSERVVAVEDERRHARAWWPRSPPTSGPDGGSATTSVIAARKPSRQLHEEAAAARVLHPQVADRVGGEHEEQHAHEAEDDHAERVEQQPAAERRAGRPDARARPPARGGRRRAQQPESPAGARSTAPRRHQRADSGTGSGRRVASVLQLRELFGADRVELAADVEDDDAHHEDADEQVEQHAELDQERHALRSGGRRGRCRSPASGSRRTWVIALPRVVSTGTR